MLSVDGLLEKNCTTRTQELTVEGQEEGWGG